jgi:cytochrome c553
MRKTLSFWLFLCAGGILSAQSAAQEITFRSCAICHDAGGIESAIPTLGGQPFDKLLQRMMAFREGSGDSTIMHRFMVGLEPSEIEDLAHFVASKDATAQ